MLISYTHETESPTTLVTCEVRTPTMIHCSNRRPPPAPVRPRPGAPRVCITVVTAPIISSNNHKSFIPPLRLTANSLPTSPSPSAAYTNTKQSAVTASVRHTSNKQTSLPRNVTNIPPLVNTSPFLSLLAQQQQPWRPRTHPPQRRATKKKKQSTSPTRPTSSSSGSTSTAPRAAGGAGSSSGRSTTSGTTPSGARRSLRCSGTSAARPEAKARVRAKKRKSLSPVSHSALNIHRFSFARIHRVVETKKSWHYLRRTSGC